MKKTNTIITLIVMASLSFGLNTNSAMSLNNDFDLSFNSNEDIYGIQFDMHYDASVISIDELTNASSLISGVDIYSRENFRKKSVLKEVCISQISGLGKKGYLKALEKIIN